MLVAQSFCLAQPSGNKHYNQLHFKFFNHKSLEDQNPLVDQLVVMLNDAKS